MARRTRTGYRDVFSTCHPAINFFYFASVMLCGMFFLHPVFLGISLVGSVAYAILLKGERTARFYLWGLVPSILLMALVNPLFNHQGVTILLYVNNNPLTWESIAYGLAAAVMLFSVASWFSCYGVVMTSDKFLYLFGRVIPALSLVLSMALRFVPRFQAQARVISNGQKCVGRDASNGNLVQKLRNGMTILSILVTWALENAIETADSMRARGFGLKGRTSFSLYRFDSRDRCVLLVLLGLVAVVLLGAATGENDILYFPRIVVKPLSWWSAVVYLAYGALCLLPLILEGLEAYKWHRLRCKA